MTPLEKEISVTENALKIAAIYLKMSIMGLLSRMEINNGKKFSNVA